MDFKNLAIPTKEIVSDAARILSPFVASFLIDATCIFATSRTSTIENIRSGSIGSLPFNIRSTTEIEDPKLLSSGAPVTKTGFIVVSSISGAWFLINSHAALSARVFDFVYAPRPIG